MRSALSTAFLVLPLLLACGCEHRIERVVLRLGPADFLGGPVPRHEPVVQIGDEARPVLVPPATMSVVDVKVQRPADGIVKFRASVPEPARMLPNEAYTLTGSRRDFRPGEDQVAVGAALVAEQTVSDWTMVRPSPEEAMVEARVPPVLGDRFVLHLRAVGATPPRLASRRFGVPAESEVVLRYGLAGGRSSRPVRFRAWLGCAGRPKRLLVRDRISPKDAGAGEWREARVRLPDAMADCRLVLRQAASSASGRGMWCPPYLLGPDSAPTQPRNLVIISLDTLRADHLSGYGYGRQTSPAIDARLIAPGTTFTQASTTFPLTQVAHMSLFTGLYGDAQPHAYTVPFDCPITLLAEIFRDGGFETAAYTEDAGVAGIFGFWHGFGRFTERAFVGAARGRDTFRDGGEFVRDHRDRRFFLFLHTYKVHNPYTFSPPYAAYFTDPTESLATVAPAVPAEDRAAMDEYDRAIREVDDQVAGFLDVLDEVGVADDTVVVLLSDHGEAFGEHGLRGHGLGGQQEQLGIPLVFRGPGIRVGRVDTPISIIDVAPTVLDLMGLPTLPLGQGKSFRAALAGAPVQGRPLFFSWIGGGTGVRVAWLKYLPSADGGRAFDLLHDPGENRPLDVDVGGLADLGKHAHEQDTELRVRLDAETGSHAAPVVPRKVEESLRALGYL